MLRIILIGLLFIVSVVLIVGVLLQPGKSAGLSGSIAGGAEQLFGKKKGKGYEVLAAKVTTICAIAFMLLCIVLVIFKDLIFQL